MGRQFSRYTVVTDRDRRSGKRERLSAVQGGHLIRLVVSGGVLISDVIKQNQDVPKVS